MYLYPLVWRAFLYIVMEELIFYTNALPVYRSELYERFKIRGWSFLVGNNFQDSEVLFGLKNLPYRSCKTYKIGNKKFTNFPFYADANMVLLNLDRSDLGFWLLLMRYLRFREDKIFIWGHIAYKKIQIYTIYITMDIFSKVEFVFSYGSHPIESLNLKNIVQVYNGVAWERPAFRPSDGLRSKLVYVGRNTAVKKLDKLMEYCDLLGIHLDIVSPDSIEYRSKHVNYVGYLKGEHLRSFLLNGNYLAMVSLGNAGLNSIE